MSSSFDYWDGFVSKSAQSVHAMIDWMSTAEEDLFETVISTFMVLFIASVVIHLFPLIIIWLVGAPFWVVAALFFGH